VKKIGDLEVTVGKILEKNEKLRSFKGEKEEGVEVKE